MRGPQCNTVWIIFPNQRNISFENISELFTCQVQKTIFEPSNPYSALHNVYCLSLCKVKAISTHFLVENRTGLSDIISEIEWHPKSASCRSSCESARYGCLVDKYGNQVLQELLFQTEKPKKTSLLKLCFKQSWKLISCPLHLVHLQFLWFYGNP